ncbi:hypothetical protein TrLO_g10160 [Triparma laevis f. longispina]|uniref:FAD/NAD(P)-binding domain-containing protein n=1 Tax=Triparma laevis f. longispina TaxID=1714387 RepID=A0A9W7CN49_9STRA|nr:hypothetical protein TrLO_g10160 [Triparma laevis f. longispina]
MVISEEKIGKRVVILGSGWASQSCIKIINDKNPEVDSITVVSPLNYFLFTPLLLSASVGTVEVRSIVEPIRSTNPFVKHIEGAAYKVDPFKKLVHIEPVLTHNPNNVTNVTIPYDTLVVSVGEEATTRAVPGARDCVFQLKTAEDAQLIRRCIVDSFERATLAMQSGTKSWKKDTKTLLTYVIVGGGPTGLEFCGELYDFLTDDCGVQYPEIIKFSKVVLIDSGRTVEKDPFKILLKDKGLERLNSRKRVGLAKQRVVAVEGSGPKGDQPPFLVKFESGQEVNCGMVIWAGGTAQRQVVTDLMEDLGCEGRRLPIDEWMRVTGPHCERGSILAMGDNACFTRAGKFGLPATAAVAGQQGPYVARLINRNYDLSVKGGPPELPSFSMFHPKEAKPFEYEDLGAMTYLGDDEAILATNFFDNNFSLQGAIAFLLWRSVYVVKQVSTRNRLLVTMDFFKSKLVGRDTSRF